MSHPIENRLHSGACFSLPCDTIIYSGPTPPFCPAAYSILPMTLRLLRKHPIPTLTGMLKLNIYDWKKTPKLAQDLLLNSKTEIDVATFQKQLVRETVNVFPFLFSFAKVNPIKSPVLVIAGEKDALFTVDEEKITAEKYGAKYIIIDGQAHNLMMESAWKQVADLIDNWITHELGLP